METELENVVWPKDLISNVNNRIKKNLECYLRKEIFSYSVNDMIRSDTKSSI